MSDDEFIYIAVRVYIAACDKENVRAKMATPLGLLTEKDCNSIQISFIKKIILPQLYNGLTHILYSYPRANPSSPLQIATVSAGPLRIK